MTEHKEFVMPAWMEPYRDLIGNTGGNSIEELMNDHGTNAQNNVIRAALIVSVDSQVRLLAQLHKRGLLVEPQEGRNPMALDTLGPLPHRTFPC